MPSNYRWFVAGVLMAVLVVTAGIVGARLSSADTEAQGMWQAKRFPVVLLEPNETPVHPDPDRFVSDWVATMPDSCDIVPAPGDNLYLYRCP